MKRDVAHTPKSAVTAKETSATLVAENRERVAVYITNDGEKAVYLALGSSATKNQGIRLNEKGGAIVIDAYTGPISVVTASGESVVTFAEV